MSKGYMRISRDIENWGWYRDSNTFRVFFHLMLKAQYQDGEYMGITLKRGQVVIGRKKLSADLGISEQCVRTSLERLSRSHEIVSQPTNKYSIITICNFDRWQDMTLSTNQQLDENLTNDFIQNQPHTKNKEINNNNRNNNNIYSDEIENLRRENEELDHTPKKEKVKKVSKTLGGRAREVWETFYNDLGVSDVPYYWTAKDAGQMKNILNALRFSREQKGMTATDDELLYALKYLLDSINDSWVMEHLSVATVFSKFNDIVAGAKAVKVKKENSDSSKYDEDGHPKVLIINGQVYR